MTRYRLWQDGNPTGLLGFLMYVTGNVVMRVSVHFLGPSAGGGSVTSDAMAGATMSFGITLWFVGTAICVYRLLSRRRWWSVLLAIVFIVTIVGGVAMYVPAAWAAYQEGYVWAQSSILSFVAVVPAVLLLVAAGRASQRRDGSGASSVTTVRGADASSERDITPGPTTCPACGAALPVDARYCPRCGVTLGAVPRPQRRWRGRRWFGVGLGLGAGIALGFGVVLLATSEIAERREEARAQATAAVAASRATGVAIRAEATATRAADVRATTVAIGIEADRRVEASRLATQTARRCDDPNQVFVNATLLTDRRSTNQHAYEASGFVRNTCNYPVRVRLELTALTPAGAVALTEQHPASSAEWLQLGPGEETAFRKYLGWRIPPDVASLRVVPKVS